MEKRIIKFLKRHQGDYYNKMELLHHLAIQQQQKKQFRYALRSLVDEGKVLRIKGGRYSWVGSLEKVQGKLVLNHKGFGFVLVDDGQDIFINFRNLKGALHEDIVQVVILPFSAGSGPEGRVYNIIKRANNRFIGTVFKEKGGYYLTIDPVTPKRGIRILRESPIKLKPGDIITVEVEDWEHGRIPVQVKAVEAIGSINVPEDDMKVICSKFDLETKFPQRVLTELNKFSIKVIQKEKSKRKDLTELTCFTIDPQDARDFDDAISLEVNSKGNWVLGIHIADVSYFVRPGSELDREARTRGTSVYFAEGTVHMLPEILSASICSLLSDADRLTLSVLIELDHSGKPLSSVFYESIIKNSRRFSYSDVQAILDSKKSSRYSEKLKEMRKLSEKLLTHRQDLGSIDFDIPEPIFHFRKGGIPHEILPSERLDSHRIVEEFMLLANRMVADKVPGNSEHSLPFIYRIHDKPPKEDIKKFLTILRRLGISTRMGDHMTPKEFRKILEKVEDSPFKNLIETLALRTMTKAIYSTENRGHFGLAFDSYTHFTSPIRRYPDLIVHRLLKKYLFGNEEKSEFSNKTLGKISIESTNAEIKAMEAEREYIKLKQIRWLLQHIGDKFSGIISGIVTSGIFVELSETLVEGFIPVDRLEEDYFEFDELTYSLVGRKTGKVFQLGKPVTVVVQEVVLEKRQAYFKVV
ncbi:MAG: ribonuclease R [Candidatus Marinimicrobia bacterium]|nr:ribonuclease R [Candidatus Neomarinimicrobiota bacterium]